MDAKAQTPDKTIYLGLAMSGAISAGAYSAGVLDFLVEALEEWEEAKRRDIANGTRTVPHHKVVIATMTGASAGAITSSIGALCAGMGARPSKAGRETDKTYAARDDADPKGKIPWHVLPELYRAWVDGPAFVKSELETAVAKAAPGRTPPVVGLLDNSDLPTGTKLDGVYSLLNAQPLMNIGRKALEELEAAASDPKRLPPRPYIAETLHLLLTQTNTRGIPYKIEVQGGTGGSAYGMMNHLDHAHFALQGLGSATFVSPWAQSDAAHGYSVESNANGAAARNKGWLWYDGKDGEKPEDYTQPNSKRLVKNTLASGAFPMGLSALDLITPLTHYNQRAWPLNILPSRFKEIKPEWPWRPVGAAVDGAVLQPPVDYRFAAVDGGAINNDPFDLARYALMENPPERSPSDVAEANRIVVMISPFPEAPTIDGLNQDGTANTRLTKILSKMIGMFVEQSRFRPDVLMRALDNTGADLWRISPSRKIGDESQPAAIACGLWGGFGGFLDIEFRRHDYELGRANCRKFLQSWFGLPSNNPHIDIVGPPINTVMATDQRGEEVRYPIIPLCGSALTDVTPRAWPTITPETYQRFIDAVIARYLRLSDPAWDKVKELLGGWSKFFLGKNPLGWFTGTVEKKVRRLTFPDLVRRDQILLEEQRRVLECCLDDKPSPYILTMRLLRSFPDLKTSKRVIFDVMRSTVSLPTDVMAQNICLLLQNSIKPCPVKIDHAKALFLEDAPIYRTPASVLDELLLTFSDIPRDTSPDDVARIMEKLKEYRYMEVSWWTGVGTDTPRKAGWAPWSETTAAYRYTDRDDGDTLDI
ncbi:patatin-like phospholipase family protein [Azospirillum sp. TSO35-2]|uniref:patatin-like phospholipase family protein n=1 Tax=Azospirillum sp. TSO35-2 TaxID=716796 RepID=UPI000D60951D|nr:patatin-like phospholipase family protein [Azospirillum sp. TSO35-2]PWC33616.1 hypothetical protein TSO352_24700 [Azospirillum sp. TSO35-2]